MMSWEQKEVKRNVQCQCGKTGGPSSSQLSKHSLNGHQVAVTKLSKNVKVVVCLWCSRHKRTPVALLDFFPCLSNSQTDKKFAQLLVCLPFCEKTHLFLSPLMTIVLLCLPNELSYKRHKTVFSLLSKSRSFPRALCLCIQQQLRQTICSCKKMWAGVIVTPSLFLTCGHLS